MDSALLSKCKDVASQRRCVQGMCGVQGREPCGAGRGGRYSYITNNERYRATVTDDTYLRRAPFSRAPLGTVTPRRFGTSAAGSHPPPVCRSEATHCRVLSSLPLCAVSARPCDMVHLGEYVCATTVPLFFLCVPLGPSQFLLRDGLIHLHVAFRLLLLKM